MIFCSQLSQLTLSSNFIGLSRPAAAGAGQEVGDDQTTAINNQVLAYISLSERPSSMIP